MKRTIALILAISALLLTGCSKEGVTLFKGNYSFKTSGSMVLFRDSEEVEVSRLDVETGKIITEIQTREYPDPIEVTLSSESGQMDITTVNAKEGEVLVTMNILGGDMLVYRATANGKSLTLDPTERKIRFSLPRTGTITGEEESLFEGSAQSTVIVHGDAERFEDIIIFEMTYSGEFDYDGGHYKIAESKIVCRAKMNEK